MIVPSNRQSTFENRKSMDVPLRFAPFLRPMVWGGRRLENVLGKSLPTAEAYGESWEVSDHRLHPSVVACGPRAGQSLRQLMEQERAELLGPAAAAYDLFPWLVKFLDAQDWLSVQVHPDEEAVGRLWPGEGSKTEVWFVLDAAPSSRIFAGLLPGIDESRLRAALHAGTVAECLHQFVPKPGDCLFLPAGTVHAVGGGVLMAEIQQTSDATFRLFDWNRRDAQGNARKLHIEEALACIDWSRGLVEPVHVQGFRNKPEKTREPWRQMLVQCPYFTLEYMQQREPFHCGGGGRLQLLVLVDGFGRLAATGLEDDLRLGQVWVLPAAMKSVSCRPDPELGMLVCTLP
jgi:mannose-6-phosphate isomerase